MDFDYEHHLAALQRTVQLHAGPKDAPPDIDAGPVYEVTLSRAYAVPVTDLWDAVTNPARLGRWFMPVSGVLQTGGHYQLEGNAGGAITLCKPHDIVRLTWEFAGNVSLVNLRFASQGSSAACLTLSHGRLPDDEHWDQFGPGATGVGWELSFLGLAFHLGNPDGPQAQRRRLRCLTRRPSLHFRQQPGLGPSRHRQWLRSRRRSGRGQPDYRLLHRQGARSSLNAPKAVRQRRAVAFCSHCTYDMVLAFHNAFIAGDNATFVAIRQRQWFAGPGRELFS